MRMTWRQFLLVLWATAAFTLLSVTDAFSTLPQRHVIPKTRTTVLNFKTSWSPSASRASISSTSRSAPSILFLSSSSFNDDKDDKTNRSSSSLSWRKKLSLKGFNKSNDVANSLFSAFLLVLLDVAFRRGFRHYAIDFPSSLAGCGALLATLLIAPPKLASRLYDTLAPGSKLLAKWLSVFFVPSLITLPLLTEGAGSATELVKVGLVVVGGFYFSLLSTAWSVVAVRKFVSKRSKEIVEIEDTATTTTTTTASPFSASFKEFQETTMTASPLSASFKEFEESLPPPTPQPSSFSKELHDRLRTMSVVTGTATVLTSQFVPRLEPYCSCAFFLWTTLYTFVVGARLPKKVTKLLHPLVTCTALTWAASYGLAIITSRPWKTILSSYRRRGSGSAVNALFHHRGIGAGDILLFLLGPAVVSLACQMYERRQLVKSNVAAVATGVTVGSAGGLFGTAAAVRLLQIGNPYLRLSLLSRNITSPLAMAMAAMLGANVSLAVALVVVTGLLGANFGPAILDAHGIDDEIARGMAMGAASHGLGTAALVNEKLAFPFAAISMALTASVGTVLVSIPLVQRMILQLTLGW